MRVALFQAAAAARLGEVPVGAVVVHCGEMVAQAHNRCVVDCNISHHAEIQALAAAGQALGNYRLNECDVYVSLEPCAMCAGAIVASRVAHLVFGAFDPKAGAVASLFDVVRDPRLNHRPRVTSGVLVAECEDLLAEFFGERR